MPHFEQQISSERIYEGKIFAVRKDLAQLENGATVVREVIEHPGGVCVVAIDDRQEVFLVRQFRYGVGEELLELPAGKLERGEDPYQAALRELHEECGCTADELLPLAEIYPTCAYDSEKIYIYLARGLHFGTQQLDENEFLTVRRMPFAELLQLALDGSITDAKTLVGVLKYAVLSSVQDNDKNGN